MADTSGSLHSVREILLLKPEGHVDQADQNRDLQQRADDSGKGLARVNTEHGDSDSSKLFYAAVLSFQCITLIFTTGMDSRRAVVFQNIIINVL